MRPQDTSFFAQLTPHVRWYGILPPVLTTLLVGYLASEPLGSEPMLVVTAYVLGTLGLFCVVVAGTRGRPTDSPSTAMGVAVYLLGCVVTGGLTLALAVLFQ